MEISYALAGVDTEIEIIEVAVGQARGRIQVRSGDVNRQEIERVYRCTGRETLDRGFAEWLCLADLSGREPDWADLLERLDAAGIMSPPRELPPALGCLDGAPWALRVYHGPTPTPAIDERQICPVMTPARQVFQAEIERIIDIIVSTVERASGA